MNKLQGSLKAWIHAVALSRYRSTDVKHPDGLKVDRWQGRTYRRRQLSQRESEFTPADSERTGNPLHGRTRLVCGMDLRDESGS
jgi:hypothetical protein